MQNHTPILIVGAGPSGLVMACELQRRGVKFRFIEQKEEPIHTSNATWIQPRTLEILDLMGLVGPFLQKGNICHAMQFYVQGREAFQLPFDQLPTTYPFALMVPQSWTEKFLTHHLESQGGAIERGVTLSGVTLQGDQAICNLTHPNGEIEMLSCDYLIAADGSNSSVREFCDLSFAGEDLTEQFIVADATIESGLSKKEIHLFFEPGLIFAAFPLGHQKYRITANLHLPYPRKLFTAAEVIDMAQERAHGAYYVKHVEWISPFWIHSKVVQQLRHGPIFLMGDAAHVHSPVGGQGLNMGIHDAFNLGWKLAMVVKGEAGAALLDSYHDERYSVIHEVVHETESATKTIMTENDFTTKLQTFSETVKSPLPKSIENKLEHLAQLNIHYKKSHAIDYTNIGGDALLQGMRALDANLNDHERLYDCLQDGAFHALLFLGREPASMNIEAVKKLELALASSFPSVKLDIISKTPVPELPRAHLDSFGEAHQRYHAHEPVLYLVRPDNMIAYIQKTFIFSGLERLLKQWLVSR